VTARGRTCDRATTRARARAGDEVQADSVGVGIAQQADGRLALGRERHLQRISDPVMAISMAARGPGRDLRLVEFQLLTLVYTL
jgi:hypothetical protein